jgi:endonuclease/exonuclease/phosphatase family metal-dependent hydrolase
MRTESRGSGCRVRRRSLLLFCLFLSATVATLFLIRGGRNAAAAATAIATRIARSAVVAPAHYGSAMHSASLLDALAAVDYLAAKYTATANDLKRANLVRRHRDQLMLDYTAATDFSRERHMYDFNQNFSYACPIQQECHLIPCVHPFHSLTRSQSCASASLRIATFNLYNVQMKWPTRRDMIARALTEVGADIIALQEVRIASPAAKHGHQAAELQQLLRSVGASSGAQPNKLSHPHLVYQRVSTQPQNEGLEEGIALLSRFPIQRWGVRILLSSAELGKRQPRRTAAAHGASDRARSGAAVDDEDDDSGLVWFSESGKPPLTVPPDSRVVLYARVSTPSSSSSSSSPVDLFVTHWPVSDREQCTAALQTKHFVDRVWHREASGRERVPQVVTGDLNVYFDFEWPIDFLRGRVLANAALNKCWSDSFARAFERRDSETGVCLHLKLFDYDFGGIYISRALDLALYPATPE